MTKVKINDVINDIVHIQNQIAGLNLLLENKKRIVERYFDKTGNRSIENDDCTVYVQERTRINYDIKALEKRLGKSQVSSFVNTKREITDWNLFSDFLRNHGVSRDEFANLKSCISVSKEVSQSKLSSLYESGKISLEDIQGCYDATVKKSIAIRMKNIDKEIPIKE